MVAITLGDPAGIGPEVCVRSLAAVSHDMRARVRVYGPETTWRVTCDALQQTLPDVEFIDVGVSGVIRPGTPNDASARAQVAALTAAVDAAKAGNIAGLCTAPISKSEARRAGFNFPGHTEFLGAAFDADATAMMFVGSRMRVVLATIHEALQDVPNVLTTERIVSAGRLAIESLIADFEIARPLVNVVALNPHAGEREQFGQQERTVIKPAIDELRGAFPTATLRGPLPPDTAFRGQGDLWIAMYHDQGLIPIKLLDFENTVNVTLGLPLVRTSPDHGVAYDIAGKGTADHRPFLSALRLCMSMADRRAAGGSR